MGQGLAVALGDAGVEVFLLARTPRPVVEPLRLFPGGWPEAVGRSTVVVIATPDGTISLAAAVLAGQGAVGQSHVVLHLSGLLDRHALAPLLPTNAGLGSFHPLQSIADPRSAPARLAGAVAGIEGDPRALAAGAWLARSLGMRSVVLPPGAKPTYHAGAVFAGNFVLALAAIADRLARDAGVAPDEASRMYLPLLQGAAANLARGPAAALTGPVARGDLETIRAHLSALGAEDRELYRHLSLALLPVAREAGLSDATARVVGALLADPD